MKLFQVKTSQNGKTRFFLCGIRLFRWKTKPSRLHYRLIKKSKYFDKNWYLAQNNDVKISGVDPIRHYLNIGWKEGRNPGPDFNTNNYLKAHEEVRRSNINPLAHFEQLDDQQKKANKLLQQSVKEYKVDPFDILLISPFSTDDGVYYWRLLFLSELLKQNGFSVHIVLSSNPQMSYAYAQKATVIIFSRMLVLKYSTELMKVMKKKTLIADLDDLLLEAYAASPGGVRSQAVKYTNAHIHNTYMENGFIHADHIIASTPRLASELDKLYPGKVIIKKNEIPPSLIGEAKVTDIDESRKIKLLYASGSQSHDFDFSEIYLDLLNFLVSHDHVTLTVLGKSTASQNLQFLGDKIQFIDKVSFSRMLEIFGEHDLLLVPLEKTPFNDSKSNIKYIEAGARGTAVLASEADEFSDVITHGVNGFLHGRDNFYEILEETCQNLKKLYEVGECARQDVIAHRSTNNKNEELIDLLKKIVC